MSGMASGRSVGSIVGMVVGGAVGLYVGQPFLGMTIGATLGGLAGGFYDTQTAPDSVNEQPSIANVAIETSAFGQVIPQVFGTIGNLAGNVIPLPNNALDQVKTLKAVLNSLGLTITLPQAMGYEQAMRFTWPTE